ncbi:hypothetical protein FF1_023817 [Malus domestica]
MPPTSAAVRMTSWGFSLGGEQGLDAGFATEVKTVAGARLVNPGIWSLQIMAELMRPQSRTEATKAHWGSCSTDILCTKEKLVETVK